MKEPISRPGVTSKLPYTPAIITSGRLLFISGQGPLDPASGEFVLESVEQQIRLTLDNLAAVAEAGGGSLAGAVKINAYLRDMADFAVFNEVFAEYFPEPRPARTTIQTNLPGFDVEIDAVIALDG